MQKDFYNCFTNIKTKTMKELKGTKTEKNLQEAFAGESMARNKYSYFASKAKKDGYVQIAAILRTSNGRICMPVWQRRLVKRALTR